MWIIGRLKPRVTLGGAQAESTTLGKQLESQHPERNSMDPRLIPLEQHVSGPAKTGSAGARVRCRRSDVDSCARIFRIFNGWGQARGKRREPPGPRGAGGLRSWQTSALQAVALSCCGAASGLLLAARRDPVNWRISMHSTFRCSKASGSMGARWFSPCLRRSLAACLFACCQRYGFIILREGMEDAGLGSSGGKWMPCSRRVAISQLPLFARRSLVGDGMISSGSFSGYWT